MEVLVDSTLPHAAGRVAVATDASQTLRSVVMAFCAARGVGACTDYVVRGGAEHRVLPVRRTVAACGIRDGDVIHLSPKSVSDNWPCGCNQWWLLASIALVIGAAGLITISIVKMGEPAEIEDYGVVLDAGSSHTTLYVYRWPAQKENGTGVVKTLHSCSTNASLSSYAGRPARAGSSLGACLGEAMRVVPAARQPATRLYLGATAGMRMLRATDSATCETILALVRNALRSTAFNFSASQARIISGREEGTFSWVMTNYLEGVFGPPFSSFFASPIERATSGALDMGGASTQIAFVPSRPGGLPENYTESLRLYGSDYKVYAQSSLCFGLTEAHRKYRANLVKEAMREVDFRGATPDPCAPRGYAVNVSASDVFEAPCTRSNINYTHKVYLFTGSSQPALCAAAVQSLLGPDCGRYCFNDRHLPPLRGNFTAFTGYYYTTQFLNLTNGMNKFSQEAFNTSVNDYCNKSWAEVKTIPHVASARLAEYCFEARYTYSVLVDGYGFNDSNWDTILFANQSASGTELGWALGMMLTETGRIPAERPEQPISTLLFVLLLLLFLFFIVLAVAFACHARQRRRDALLCYKPPMYGSV